MSVIYDDVSGLVEYQIETDDFANAQIISDEIKSPDFQEGLAETIDNVTIESLEDDVTIVAIINIEVNINEDSSGSEIDQISEGVQVAFTQLILKEITAWDLLSNFFWSSDVVNMTKQIVDIVVFHFY